MPFPSNSPIFVKKQHSMTAVLIPAKRQKRQTSSELSLRLPGDQSDEAFFQLCQLNPELRIERNSQHEILIMPPTTSETGNRNAKLLVKLGIWNEKHKLGEPFDSSTGFKLPNGAERSPDLAWIRKDRWDALTKAERRRFAPIAPDFVLELRSEDQNLASLKEKMEEYMASGCRLGWLVDPQGRKTFVYTENGDIQTIPFDVVLTGGEVLEGFELRMADLFED